MLAKIAAASAFIFASAANPDKTRSTALPQPPVNVSQVRRFSCDDPALQMHLQTYGFAVVRGVASAGELEEAWKLLWQLLNEEAGWLPHQPSTWSDETLQKMGQGAWATGILEADSIGQSDLSWFVRTLPGVRCIFSRIWGTNNLLTSFDGVNIFRPWHSGRFPKTEGGWFHVDQGKGRQGLHAIQGFLSLTQQDSTTGGLYIIPGSHLNHSRVVAWQDWPRPPAGNDFYKVPWWNPILAEPQRLVACQAGDFVLWDSRTAHCSGPAIEWPKSPVDQLLRAVVYACLTPGSWATEEALKARRIAYDQRLTTGHWPHLIPKRTSRPLEWQRAELPLFEEAPQERKALIG
eukprot:TRINITY_DN3994_c0_g4_i1.p1 TRINITY_DN3994_c0_g4~~TRINITY_DN3994_c0_g4_i1.p1  ORF type:complete len:348 (-),score=41.75 TRINITY_DN3994_c0_g4_i1:692-1735(-)